MPCTGDCHTKRTKSVTIPADDNVWGSDEESIIPYADLQRAHASQGYLDGVVQAQELSLQEGFDNGYPKGALLGLRVGRILAKLHGTERFEDAVSALNIKRVLDKEHFDDQLDIKANHNLITTWEET